MTKPKENIREKAEKHWEYSRDIVLLLDNSLMQDNIKYFHLMEHFYIEAFIHGFKHGKEIR